MDKVNKEELIEAVVALIENVEENKVTNVWGTTTREIISFEDIEEDIKHLKKILRFKEK